MNKKPAGDASAKQARDREDADEEAYRPEPKKKRPAADESTKAVRPADDISGTGEVRRVKKTQEKAKPTRAEQVSELDELEDVAKSSSEKAEEEYSFSRAAEDDGGEAFQASSSVKPEVDTAGLEKIAEQLKKYNLGDDLPDDDELPDLDEDDDGEDSDFDVTDFKNV